MNNLCTERVHIYKALTKELKKTEINSKFKDFK